MPAGGWGMIENGLKAIGREPDPIVRDTFTKYRKTHNQAVFDVYTPGDPGLPEIQHHHRSA